jgi:hypothetical protein
MTITLTDEQRQALAAHPGAPLRVIDAQTNDLYVLVRAEVYDRLQPISAPEELDIREAYPLMDDVACAEGWDDPAMDIYNDLDPRKLP